APSTTGRYPNLGPLLLCQAGVTLVDDVGGDVMDSIAEGDIVAVDGDRILVDGEVVATGVRQDLDRVDAAIEAARSNIGPELERFANNTVVYMRQEIDLLTGSVEVPETRIQFAGRQVL